MGDESLYISTYEAALALVATSMKKARLRLDTLIVNSIMGGILFTTGGMFHVMLESHLSETLQQNRGYVELLQGLCYPIGLFYVVILGCELFNSNILFFSVGLVRGAVSIFDVIISWIISWLFNLIANIFVCYIICYYSTVFKTELMINGSISLLENKCSFMFHETLIKGIAGNFFVCLAIYLQIMAKPIHVKFLLMVLPIFTFVSIGFSHSVADMFILIMGLINDHAHGNSKNKISVGLAIWKVLIPSTLGNIIGGSFFGIVIPWYSHIYTVEQDQRLLSLPRYELRDEQPEINTDSRVVRTKTREYDDGVEDEDVPAHMEKEEVLTNRGKKESSTDSSVNSIQQNNSPPRPIYSESMESIASPTTGLSLSSHTHLSHPTKSKRSEVRSPKNVFPVYGMGQPLKREQSIASGYAYYPEDDNIKHDNELESRGSSAEYMGSRVQRYLSRRFSAKSSHADPEQNVGNESITSLSPTSIRQYSLSSHRSIRGDRNELSNRMNQAGISDNVMENSDNVAGTSSPRLKMPKFNPKKSG